VSSPVWCHTDTYPRFNRTVLKEPQRLSSFIRHALSLIKHLSPTVLTPKLHYKFQWLFECHFQEGGSWPVPNMSLPDDPVQLLSVNILWLSHGHQHAANMYLQTNCHYTKHIHINGPLILYSIAPEKVSQMWHVMDYHPDYFCDSTHMTRYGLQSRLAEAQKIW